jgi:hypothetical protein
LSNLAPIASRIGKLLRMLMSSSEGEIINAVRLMKRTLASQKTDVHALADTIETNATRRFSEADALEIYQRGVQQGRSDAEAERGFHDVREPDWRAIARECADHPERLRERGFVKNMVFGTACGASPSEKQARWLMSIYARIQR